MKQSQEQPRQKTPEEYQAELIDLAEEILNEAGQKKVRESLDNDDVRSARIYLLGALDRAAEQSIMSADMLQRGYDIVGFSKDEAVQIRRSASGPYSSRA